MGYECKEHDEPTTARFVFTDTDSGDSIATCTEHLPDFLLGTYMAIMTAQGFNPSDVARMIEASSEVAATGPRPRKGRKSEQREEVNTSTALTEDQDEDPVGALTDP